MAHLSTWIRDSCLALAVGLSLAACGGPSLPAGGNAGQATPPPTPSEAAIQPSSPAPAPPAQKIPGASATVGLLLPLSGPRAALGEAGESEAGGPGPGFAAAWAEGRALSLQDAVKYALEAWNADTAGQ